MCEALGLNRFETQQHSNFVTFQDITLSLPHLLNDILVLRTGIEALQLVLTSPGIIGISACHTWGIAQKHWCLTARSCCPAAQCACPAAARHRRQRHISGRHIGNRHISSRHFLGAHSDLCSALRSRRPTMSCTLLLHCHWGDVSSSDHARHSCCRCDSRL